MGFLRKRMSRTDKRLENCKVGPRIFNIDHGSLAKKIDSIYKSGRGKSIQDVSDPVNPENHNRYKHIRGRMVQNLEKLGFMRYCYFPDANIGALGHAEIIWS